MSKSGTWVKSAVLSLAVFLSALPAFAAEPLVGRWLLSSQEVGGQKMTASDLTLRVNSAGQGLEFAYSVPVNHVQFVSLHFSARLDGTEADMTNGNGQKIGTVKVVKSGASAYRIVIAGPNRPTASGTMTVSADGKTLKSESDSMPSGRSAPVHTVQVFSRQ